MPSRNPRQPRPAASPNILNQEQVGYMFQDLKQNDPRVWQAITSLKAAIDPAPFYAEIILPGQQTVADDVLDHACILRLPIDPYGRFNYNSIILQDVMIACKQMPVDEDYIADILITRNKRQNFESIFKSDYKLNIKAGTYSTKIDFDCFGINELFDDDEFRIDVLQTDTHVSDCWIVLRGTADFQKNNPPQQVDVQSANIPPEESGSRRLRGLRNGR